MPRTLYRSGFVGKTVSPNRATPEIPKERPSNASRLLTGPNHRHGLGLKNCVEGLTPRGLEIIRGALVSPTSDEESDASAPGLGRVG